MLYGVLGGGMARVTVGSGPGRDRTGVEWSGVYSQWRYCPVYYQPPSRSQ